MNIDASQRFIFGLEGSPEPLGSFKLDNIYVPTLGSPSLTNFEMRNEALSGYRWIHESATTDLSGWGSLKLQRFLNGSPTGEDIISFNDDGGTIIFPGITDAKYIVQQSNPYLPNSQPLSVLSTGIVKNTTLTGVLSIATPGTDYYAPGSDLNLNSHKAINLLDPTNPQDAATKSYVDSAIDNTFGPDVALPFAQLNFNWGYVSVTNPSPYELVNTLTDSQESKKYRNRILNADSNTEWSNDYTLIGNSDLNGIYEIKYLQGVTTYTPFSIQIYPFAPSQTLTIIDTPLSLNGHKISNLLNPTNAQDAATKSYIDGSTITLTGSVTGNGNVNGSFATSFSNSQTVSGTTQAFNYSNALTSSIFSIQNTNSFAVTNYRAGSSTDYIEAGYEGANDYSFINIQGPSNDRLAFRVNGTGVAALLQSGLFGLGTITPTLAKLQINGGVQNVVGEESCIRVISALSSAKIEIQNTTPTTGKLYELRSSSIGTFDITDRTGSATRFSITSAGNIGINMGLGTPNAPLQFVATTASRKIVLFETSNNDHQVYAFGVNSNVLRYQVPANTADHVFYAGVNSTTSNEVARISGVGDFTIPGTVYGRRSSGALSMTGNVTATVVAANTWTKVAGTTAIVSGNNQFSQTANNRLAYNGTTALGGVCISASCSFSHNVLLGATVNFAIYKNGVQISTGMGSVQSGMANVNNATVLAFTSLSNGDFLEVFCRSSAAGNITVSDMVNAAIAA